MALVQTFGGGGTAGDRVDTDPPNRGAAFGRWLRVRRETAGLTQHELAVRAGVSAAMVRDIEQGRTVRPRRQSVEALCGALGSSPDVVLGDAGPFPPSGGRSDVGCAADAGGPATVAILGPLTVERVGHPVTLGAARQRALLGRLALTPTLAVSRADMIDVLWGDAPPPSAVNLVQTYVARLRRACGSDTAGGRVVASTPRGYRLDVDPERLDLVVFRRLVSQARSTARDDPRAAVELLDRAAALWRGDPLQDVEELRDHPLAVAILGERIAGALLHADIAATAGLGARAVPVLRVLTVRHPLHEPLHGRLMRALATCGLQAEALAVFDTLQRRLVEQLGIDAGPELAECRQRVLRQEWSASPSIAPHAQLPRTPSLPFQAPARVADFTGRMAELQHLGDLLRRPLDDAPETRFATCVVAGPPGVGKTAVALQAARDLAASYPDGQLYMDLHAQRAQPARPIDVLTRFLRALGVRGDLPANETECVALYRTVLASRRVLVILDDARDSAQVRALLPGCGGSAAIVTSRRRIVDLSGVPIIHLAPLSEGESVALLAAVAGASRVAAERQSAAELVRRCGGLPLAIRAAGSRLAARPSWSVQMLNERLADERHRLSELRVGDLDVAASFATSYHQLPQLTARLFRLLAYSEINPITVDTAHAVMDRPRREIETGLETLVDLNLLDPLGAAGSRCHYHDLLRLYGAARAVAEDPPTVRHLTRLRAESIMTGRPAHHVTPFGVRPADIGTAA